MFQLRPLLYTAGSKIQSAASLRPVWPTDRVLPFHDPLSFLPFCRYPPYLYDINAQNAARIYTYTNKAIGDRTTRHELFDCPISRYSKTARINPHALQITTFSLILYRPEISIMKQLVGQDSLCILRLTCKVLLIKHIYSKKTS